MISCRDAQQLLELNFPAGSFPQALLHHLNSCTGCRQLREELLGLETSLSDANAAPLLRVDSGQFLQELNSRIDRADAIRKTRRFSPRWVSLAAAAALLVMTAVSSLIGYRYGQLQEVADVETVVYDAWGLFGETYTDSIQYDLGPEMIDLIFSELSSVSSYEIEEIIIDELTADDLEKLDEQFNMGGLL